MQNQVTEIQAGWSVWDRDGRELGKVVRLDPHSMWVKGKGLFAREMEIPRSLVREAESGSVELSVGRSEV
jgi:hypothetical protein